MAPKRKKTVSFTQSLMCCKCYHYYNCYLLNTFRLKQYFNTCCMTETCQTKYSLIMQCKQTWGSVVTIFAFFLLAYRLMTINWIIEKIKVTFAVCDDSTISNIQHINLMVMSQMSSIYVFIHASNKHCAFILKGNVWTSSCIARDTSPSQAHKPDQKCKGHGRLHAWKYDIHTYLGDVCIVWCFTRRSL